MNFHSDEQLKQEQSNTMEHLSKLKNTFFDYLSPKRRRTVGPSTPSNQLFEEQHTYFPNSDPPDLKAQDALRRKLGEIGISDTRFGSGSRKRPRDSSEVGGSESLVSDQVSPEESASQITPLEYSTDGHSDEESEESYEEAQIDIEREEQMEAGEKVAAFLARQREYEKKKEEIEQVKLSGDWHPDEVFLFARLSLRCFEPILPMEFKWYFPTFPEDLFTSEPGKTFLDYHGERNRAGGHISLQRLTQLGGGVLSDRRIIAAIHQYMKWTAMDGGYHTLQYLPVITDIIKVREDQPSSELLEQFTTQMNDLAELHRESLLTDTGEYKRDPPIIYGLMVANSRLVVFTLDSAFLNAKIRHIADFDFSQHDQAVWNGLAVAIVACAARNYTMQFTDEMQPKPEEIDPDL